MISNLELTNIFVNTCVTWKNDAKINEQIFSDFTNYVDKIEPLKKHEITIHVNRFGYGEKSFWFMWHLLVNDMPHKFKFLEIGVYKGSILSLIQLSSNLLGKSPKIFGLTPLSTAGDKYLNSYENDDYMKCIGQSFSVNNIDISNITIINGLSTDKNIQEETKSEGPFNIVYIDGSHDYDVVLQDIEFADSILESGSYLVMDDASSHLNFLYHRFNGHEDVATATENSMILTANYKHLFACGHNRIWKKI